MWHGWGLLEVLQKDKGLTGLFVNSPICVFPLKKKSQSYFSHYLYQSTTISKNVVGEILSVCFCKIKCLGLWNAKMQGRRENIFIVLVWTSVSTNCFLKLFYSSERNDIYFNCTFLWTFQIFYRWVLQRSNYKIGIFKAIPTSESYCMLFPIQYILSLCVFRENVEGFMCNVL